MIDLHTHTTASDGRCAPRDLVARAAAAGVTVLGVTDHDTVAGCQAAADSCAAAGLQFVPGIEVTAVRDGRDLHVLGYFIDTCSAPLQEFLDEQRRHRQDRIRRIIARLRSFGIDLDEEQILRPAIDDPTRAAGRPWVARALVAGGHVTTTDEAFDRWLSRGRPAYEPRRGAAPGEVVARIHEAGGLASLAHPALIGDDSVIPDLVRMGLDALEAYHSKHDEPATSKYLAMAKTLGVAVSGGSDFHGDPTHGPAAPGTVALPPLEFNRLVRLKASAS